LEQDKLAELKKKLLEEKEHLIKRIEFIDKNSLGVALEDSIGELSTYDNHPADLGSEVFERSKDLALREDAVLKIVAIGDALQKIEDGTYGICDVCGQDIPLARLEVIPYTTMCLSCKANIEAIDSKNQRPVEEEVIGSFMENEIEGVMYDSEDAWQEVARFNEHAGCSKAGAYYGDSGLCEDDRGSVEEVDSIPYERGDNGMLYQSFRSTKEGDS